MSSEKSDFVNDFSMGTLSAKSPDQFAKSPDQLFTVISFGPSQEDQEDEGQRW